MASGELEVEAREAVETFVADWLADQRIPGAAIAVVDGADVAYTEGFGARSLEDNVPTTPDTLFGVGSCTKSVTAAAVMQLIERGQLALEDHVDEYRPHLATVPGDPITVEELLTHTSGMPSDGAAGPLISRSAGPSHVEVPLSSEADFRRHVQQSVDRRVTDREAFFYYNSGYTILGRIVESVTGQPYAEYVDANVLTPVGMERSTFDQETFEADDDRMTPYRKESGSMTESAFPFDPLLYPAGGLVSSVRELAAYLQLYIGQGTVDGETVLEPGSVDAMATPIGTFGTYFDGREVGYGYGLMIEEYLGDRLIGHGGSIVVSNAWFGYLEDAEVGVAIACTTSPEAHPSDVGMAVLALLQGADPAAVQPHYRLKDALERATGTYEDYREVGSATVERVGGTLRIDGESAAGGGMELLATPTSVGDDELVCTTTMASGFERQARFVFGEETDDLFFERARLIKSA